MAIIRDDGAPGSYRSILACQAQDLPGRRVDALMGRENKKDDRFPKELVIFFIRKS